MLDGTAVRCAGGVDTCLSDAQSESVPRWRR
jgi:hypothetical protein